MTTHKAVRDYVLWTGAEKVRITRSGEVHALGTMPNTNKRGWYFYGYIEGVLRKMQEAQ